MINSDVELSQAEKSRRWRLGKESGRGYRSVVRGEIVPQGVGVTFSILFTFLFTAFTGLNLPLLARVTEKPHECAVAQFMDGDLIGRFPSSEDACKGELCNRGASARTWDFYNSEAAYEDTIRSNFHTRIEAINKLDLDNQAAEAELAFNRWNTKALYGNDGEAPTTLEAFDGEKDDMARATRLNGLLHLQGMEAGNAASMYGKASETALRDILGALSPQARLAVRDRLLAKRNATLARMEHYGFTQREVAVREKNKALMASRAQKSAELAALEAKRIDDDFAKEKRNIVERYDTSIANMLTKEAWDNQEHAEGEIYEDYEAYYKENALNNKNGALTALEAKRLEAVARIGGAYSISTKELLEQQRTAILDSLGVSEKDVANNAQLAEAVDGQLSAYKSKLGGTLIDSMIDSGLLTFAEDALKDDNSLISDYGITDVRVRIALREKLESAKTRVERQKIQHDNTVNLEISRSRLLADNGTNWLYSTEYYVKLRDEAEKEGRFDDAAKYNGVIADRQKAAAGAVEQKEKREQGNALEKQRNDNLLKDDETPLGKLLDPEGYERWRVFHTGEAMGGMKPVDRLKVLFYDQRTIDKARDRYQLEGEEGKKRWADDVLDGIANGYYNPDTEWKMREAVELAEYKLRGYSDQATALRWNLAPDLESQGIAARYNFLLQGLKKSKQRNVDLSLALMDDETFEAQQKLENKSEGWQGDALKAIENIADIANEVRKEPLTTISTIGATNYGMPINVKTRDKTNYASFSTDFSPISYNSNAIAAELLSGGAETYREGANTFAGMQLNPIGWSGFDLSKAKEVKSKSGGIYYTLEDDKGNTRIAIPFDEERYLVTSVNDISQRLCERKYIASFQSEKNKHFRELVAVRISAGLSPSGQIWLQKYTKNGKLAEGFSDSLFTNVVNPDGIESFAVLSEKEQDLLRGILAMKKPSVDTDSFTSTAWYHLLKGITKNFPAEDVRWYRKAAEQGNTKVQESLKKKGLSW